MRIEQTASGDAMVLSLIGEFDRNHDATFLAHANVLLEEGRKKILADLSEASIVTSTGFGALLTTCRRLRQAGGDLALVGLRKVALEAFRLLELDGKIPAFESREDAESYLASIDAPPVVVQEVVQVELESDEGLSLTGTLQTVSEREVQFTTEPIGVLPEKGAILRIRFELPGAGEVDGAHVVVAGVMKSASATLIHADFDLLPQPGREAIRRFAR